MKRDVSAIFALTRWRAFGEAQACDRFRQENSHVRKATVAKESAEHELRTIVEARAAMLTADLLDLHRLQLTAQIESVVADRAQQKTAALSLAVADREVAQSAFVAARAELEVARCRGNQMQVENSSQYEKVLFDRMADLHNQTRERQR